MSYDLIGRLVVAGVAIGLAILGALCVGVFALWVKRARQAEQLQREADAYSAAQRVVVVLGSWATDDGNDPDDVRVH